VLIRVNLCLKNCSVLSVSSVALFSLTSLWHWTCRSTIVENPLQINLFMQNKPNLVRRGGFQVLVWQSVMQNLHFCRKPKTNPIKANQTQFLPEQTQNKPNSNPNLYRLGNLGKFAVHRLVRRSLGEGGTRDTVRISRYQESSIK